MKRLSQFLYKLLLTALVGIFISISTFPGEVIALNLSKIAPQFREQARQQEAQKARPQVPRPGGAAPGAPVLEEGVPPPDPDLNGCPPPSYNIFGTPPTISSTNGVLEVTLTASDSSSFKVANATFTTDQNKQQAVTLYKTDQNELDQYMYMPPILQVSPGDTIKLKLDNELTNTAVLNDIDTNLHYHGFNVSPSEGADNVLEHVKPKTAYQMNFKIPDNHQPGLFWYHPHVHTDSDTQVFGGMSGGIIVNGIEKYYPILNGIPLQTGEPSHLTERVILFKDLGLLSTDNNCYKCYTLNSVVNPNLTIRPGEVQFWRIGNIGSDTYMNLSLEDATTKTRQPFYILARDGNVVSQPLEQYQILLPPANRVEVLVIGGLPSSPKTSPLYNLVSDAVPNTDPNNSPSSFDGNQRIVATVSLQDDPVNYNTGTIPLVDYIKNQEPSILDSDLPSPTELAQWHIPNKNKRQFEFSQNTSNNIYRINNKQYDFDRIDTIVHLNDIEEWTLVNATPVHHVFHIHQLDFIVTNINGIDQPLQGYEDSIDLPPCSIGLDNDTCQPGTESKTVVRIPFTNPLIAAKYDVNGRPVGGEFVYHCHLLFHEDNGMMQNIQVLPASS
ncbi:MAG: multicopper oxidase domain-containing protein [Nostoc sp.]|uniref:multicopper oxidase family protein n=1 Tax=Nostoc sp. TaxID=1180 RepID=UPI002FFBD348